MPSVALGIEIAEDRSRTSIVAAGPVDDSDMILVDLVAYLDGTDAAGTILELRATRRVVAVAIDPHSPAATLLGPLRAAKVKELLKPSTSDVVVAHGEFVDVLAAGRLRHAAQPALTARCERGRSALSVARWGGRGVARRSTAHRRERRRWRCERGRIVHGS